MEPLQIYTSNKKKIVEELTPDKLLRYTRKGGNPIYSFTYRQAPNVMLEVARLRELSFQNSGGGTGKLLDIDHYDVNRNPYEQLIVWDPYSQEIIGGYRYALCRKFIRPSLRSPALSMNTYFRFSNKFIKKYLPYSIELGRAWVQPAFQATGRDSRSIFALDNLWDGLGALLNQHPQVEYFFGKVTVYQNYSPQAFNILQWFLHHYLNDNEKLLLPANGISINPDFPYHRYSFCGNDFQKDLRVLPTALKIYNEKVPPLINAYLNLTNKMKVFGTVRYPDFGNTYEIGILIRIKDIYPEKLARYTIYEHEKAEASYA
jgi:hypothetical protein